MSLPKPNTPTYKETVPSTKKQINIRPFLVKEEKILLMATEGSHEDKIQALKTVIGNCCEGVNVEELTTFDFEWLFLKLRSISVGQNMNVKIKGDNQEEPIDISIDLDEAKMIYPEDHNKTINLRDFEDCGLIMKYPTVAQLASLQAEGNIVDIGNSILIECIDKVYGKESVDNFHDYKREEQLEFLENLCRQDMEEIDKFFKTMPYVEIKIEYVDGDESKTLNIKGLDNFFQ